MEKTYLLSDEEKAHIQAEEIYRLSLRRDLEAKEPIISRKSRLWRLLNSSFALWFLSSVVLAGMAAIITKYEGGRAERARQTETVRRLDTEIADRLFATRAALCLDRDSIARGEPFAPAQIYRITVDYLNNTVTSGPRKLDFSVYSEYKNRTFRSLAFELSTIIDSSQVPIVKQLVIDYEKITDDGGMPKNERVDLEKSRNVVESLLEKVNGYLREDRWRRRSIETAKGECGY